MGVLDGEVTPTIYYGLPHELPLAAKVEEGSAVLRRGHGDWDEGSLGFIISFSPTHTHHHPPIPILVVPQPLLVGLQPFITILPLGIRFFCGFWKGMG